MHEAVFINDPWLVNPANSHLLISKGQPKILVARFVFGLRKKWHFSRNCHLRGINTAINKRVFKKTQWEETRVFLHVR